MREVKLTLLLLVSVAVSSADAQYERALSFYNKTDYAGAINQLRPAATDAKSLALLGQAYLMSDEFRLATDTLERAMALDPANSVTMDWLGRAYGRRAETAFPIAAIGLAMKARDAFEKAVHLDANNNEAVNDLFEYYLEAPAMLGGGIDKARSLLPLIEKKDPAEGHFARARMHESQKEYGRAEFEYRRALALAPGDVGRTVDLAKFLASRGQDAESDKTFALAEKLQPDLPRLLYARAEAWIRTKRNPDLARELLRRYIASTTLTPDDVPRADALRLMKKAQGN